MFCTGDSPFWNWKVESLGWKTLCDSYLLNRELELSKSLSWGKKPRFPVFFYGPFLRSIPETERHEEGIFVREMINPNDPVKNVIISMSDLHLDSIWCETETERIQKFIRELVTLAGVRNIAICRKLFFNSRFRWNKSTMSCVSPGRGGGGCPLMKMAAVLVVPFRVGYYIHNKGWSNNPCAHKCNHGRWIF